MKEKALKLADDLAFQIDELSMWTRNESANMIRKLVEELDCWQLTAQHWEFMSRNLGQIVKRQEQDKALDNLMAWQQEFNKPVAWMNPEDGNCVSDAYKQRYPFDDKDKLTIPLYTAPQTISTPQPQTFTGENPFTKTRELSDEEILKIYQSIWEGDLTIEEINNSEIRFAKAILKKASEK